MTDHDGIKAGRRHSASDSAIMQAMRDDWRGITAKMSDYFKALGFEDTDDDGTITPDEAAEQGPPAVKALDYHQIAELVEGAVLDALDDLDGVDDADPMAAAVEAVLADDDEDDAPRVLIYDRYAVLCLAAGDWKIPYRVEAGVVVLDTPDAWQRVEKEWRPVAGAQPITALGDAVKMLDDGETIEGYAVRFGAPDEPDLSEMRDYFTKSTDFWLKAWDRRPMLYHHALDAATKAAPVIGQWLEAGVDDVGVWLRGQLDRAHKYHAAVKELARRGLLRISSDSAPHLVQREPQPGGVNEVTRWPLMAASLTPSPAEPRLLPVELKTLLADLGVSIDDPSPEATEDADRERPDGAKAAEEEARRLALEIDLLTLETEQ